MQQLPHSCRYLHARDHTSPARLKSHAANAQGGLLPLEKSQASKRAAARAAKERAAVHDGLKDAKVTGILVVAALTAGAMAVMQVLQGQSLFDGRCTLHLLMYPLPPGRRGSTLTGRCRATN